MISNNEIFDLAIIGAGPAGSTFARILAKLKPEWKIALIDGQDNAQSKPCGGLLAPDAQKVLARYSLVLPNEILATPQIFSVKTVDLVQNLECSYQRMYLNMNRYAFDQWLISLIPNHVLIERVKCLAVEKQDQLFALTLSNQEVIHSRLLIGADGANSLVRQKFLRKEIAHKYIAIQEWFRQREEQQPVYYCIFDRKTSDSVSWLLHKDDYVLYGGAFLKENCREKFLEQKQRFAEHQNYQFGDLVKREACQVVSPQRLKDFQTGIPGIYLVGEAAGLISASSFEEISYAFESGEALAKAFTQSEKPKEILKIYRRNLRPLIFKLWQKMKKRDVLVNPCFRKMIMKSGIESIEIAEN